MIYVQINWSNVDELVDSIARKIKMRGLDRLPIFGVPRGGLIPAVMLSHQLRVPLLTNCSEAGTEGFILVDDILDTGSTFHAFSDLPAVKVKAALYSKGNPRIKGFEDVIVGQILEASDSRWLLFPWERPENVKGEILEFKRSRG